MQMNFNFLNFRKVTPDGGSWNRNTQNWLTNIKMLCLTVIICLNLEKSTLLQESHSCVADTHRFVVVVVFF